MIKQNIPNAITLLNLFFGCCAMVMTFNFRLDAAMFFIGLALVADFADGLVARSLKVSSPLGEQLDSLADMVSFGVVPGLIMYKILSVSVQNVAMPDFLSNWGVAKTTYNMYVPLVGFLITIFSGLRLAIFNVDTGGQTNAFRGLPTPSSCTLVLGIWIWVDKGFYYTEYVNLLFLVPIIVAFLLVSPISMVSNKFKGAGFAGNEMRYIMFGLAVTMLVLLGKYALAPAILLYIAISITTSLLQKFKS
jgi:CDP-diacylglycerol---serine O-phosphatidyltransferase